MAEIFISYARRDSAFAIGLATRLRDCGLDVWVDQLDIKIGDRWDRAIQQALESSRVLVVVLSPASVASDNVMDEVNFAIEEKKTIVPVLHQICKTPFRLRSLQFIELESNSDQGFSRLLKALL
jgi:hypothetical protein